MRIVVTGGSGNVGTALLRCLAESGRHHLVGVSRRRPPDVPPYDAAEWVCVDVGARDAMPALRDAFAGADAVVHLAWAISPSHDRDRRRRTNQNGTAAVVAAVREAGVGHLVHQSSVGTYAPGSGRTVDESWPATGIETSSYSVDKAAAEVIVARAEDEVTVARVRPALIFQDAAASEVARYFAGPLVPRVLIRRGVLRFAPLPAALAFQVVHADDVARALELILTQRAGGPFNVAAQPIIDRDAWSEVFGGVGPPVPPWALRAAAAATWRARLQPTEPGWLDMAVHAPFLDTGRIEAIGWTPRHDAREVLGEFIDAMGRHDSHPGPLLHGRRIGLPARLHRRRR